MARQSTTPVQFQRTTRKDEGVLMSSGRAGKTMMIGFIPVLRGDSASGRFGVDAELAEMPRPLLNAVHGNVQAWFVPKSAHPQFSGYDEFMHSYQGEQIKALGQDDREPPRFYQLISTNDNRDIFRNSEMAKTLGIHMPFNQKTNSDIIDAFNLVYNFRLAAHSSKLERRPYASEDLLNSVSFPPAFWPSGRWSAVVPDYERALVVGALDLDVSAGRIPVSGIGRKTPMPDTDDLQAATYQKEFTRDGEDTFNAFYEHSVELGRGGENYNIRTSGSGVPDLWAEMENTQIVSTLADLDKARETQAFAKLRAAMAGNDATGFDNDDAIVAELMQGFNVPADQFKRPWLLDSARVPFGMVERHATDGQSLDQSVTRGRMSATLNLNLPQQDVGGLIIFTLEVLPERLDERGCDMFLNMAEPSMLPDALRDVLRTEPVDLVENRRIDGRHTDPYGLYGFEPMNNVWNRNYTRLGGDFYKELPSSDFQDSRAAIWESSVVDPQFTRDHFLAPDDFPHEVFSDTLGSAFEFVCRHSVAIRGLTQIGDVLHENNDDYDAIYGLVGDDT